MPRGLLHAGLVPALAALVRSTEIRPGDDDAFATAALDHNLAGFALRAIGEGRWAPPPPVAERVRRTHAERSLIAGLLRLELAACAPILTAACDGAAPIVLKGPSVAARLYAHDVELRPYVDLDLLVPRDRLRAAADALAETRGFALAASERFFAGRGEPWPGFAEEFGHELVLTRRAAGRVLHVELHWRMGDDARLDYAALAPRAAPVAGLPGGALAPDAADELLILAVHLMHHSVPIVLWCADVARARDALGEHEWHLAFARAREHGLTWELHAGLDRAAAILGGGDRARPEAPPRGARAATRRAISALPEELRVHAGRMVALPWAARVAYTRRAGQAAWARVAPSRARSNDSA